MPISFFVNNQPVTTQADPSLPLLDVLRDELGLTGTKQGCDHEGECGACTVLIDDVPHYSCSILTHTVRSRKVTTIEGLAAPDGTLHPVQQGVIDEQGFQCAFCMSGFIMAAVGFLKTNPNPTREELARSEDMGDYYRIRSDSRDLNYTTYRQYFTEGDMHEAEIEDYTSHNTHRLGVEDVVKVVGSLPEVQEELKDWKMSRSDLYSEDEVEPRPV